ncbi:MAG: ClbS/DfsB family four-helix bundle protein [Actinomycetota bacterium]|nr:ClbS/DfsB family four-helix bundle protein [Actinomycetota bacterium]
MTQPSRQEAISILEEGNARVEELLAGLPDADLTREATIGGGDWSAKDLIGHLASWEELALRSLGEWRRGEVPWVEREDGPLRGPGTEAIDAFNARAVAEKQRLSLDDVRRGAQEIHQRLVAEISALSDDEWRGKASYPTEGGRRNRLVTLLGAILGAPKGPFAHAFAHVPDVEAFVASLQAQS